MLNGSKTEDNGQTVITSLHPEQSFSLTGRVTEKPTTQALCKNARTELFIPLRVIPVTLADKDNTQSVAAVSTDTVSRRIKKDGCSFE